MSQPYLSISRVDMAFTRGGVTNPVLKDVNLDVQRGEYISLIGHSGCGKSTVLNIVAGLLRATSGGVIVDGREVNSPGPDRALVFQNHSLLPWLTVYQNVEIAVQKIFRGKRSAAEQRDWILHNLDMVSMSHALDRLPAEISCGRFCAWACMRTSARFSIVQPCRAARDMPRPTVRSTARRTFS